MKLSIDNFIEMVGADVGMMIGTNQHGTLKIVDKEEDGNIVFEDEDGQCWQCPFENETIDCLPVKEVMKKSWEVDE